jgi:hypothetical protein
MEGDNERADPRREPLNNRNARSAARRALIDDIIRHSGPLDEDAIRAIQDSRSERD